MLVRLSKQWTRKKSLSRCFSFYIFCCVILVTGTKVTILMQFIPLSSIVTVSPTT